jgi:hypothetical protein
MPQVNFDQPNNGMPQQYDPSMPMPVTDPVTGEDASNDSRLTFLVAVVLDPAPPAPPAPAPGTEGAQPPANGAAPPPSAAQSASAR